LVKRFHGISVVTSQQVAVYQQSVHLSATGRCRTTRCPGIGRRHVRRLTQRVPH
jgi:hypothetical protein